MNKFISRSVFISYCEYLDKSENDLYNLEKSLNKTSDLILALKIIKKHKIIPKNILKLIPKYFYIDRIMYNTFILKIDTLSYDKLYEEIIDFILFMDRSLIYYQDNKHNLYLKSEIEEIDQLIQELKDKIYLNNLIEKIKINLD
jgi:hypothetical protein